MNKGVHCHDYSYIYCYHVAIFKDTAIGYEYFGGTSAVQRVESVSDRMSYIILRGCWCHIIVLNVHARTEDKLMM
jgi:hypothetical protein